jgi:transposase
VLGQMSELESRISQMLSVVHTREAELEKAQKTIADITAERDRLREAYARVLEELALLRRRIFVATAERVDTRGLQLEFSELMRSLDTMAGTLAEENAQAQAGQGGPPGEHKPKAEGQPGAGPQTRPDGRKQPKHKPKGRRKLEDTDLPVVRVEVPDELFETLVAQGKAERFGFEESSKLGHERGGPRRVVMARVKYRAVGARGEHEIETAPLPAELVPRCLACASTLAYIATCKFCDGLPLYRIEKIYERSGFPLDRGTMSRWLEHIGAVFGATVIEAARKYALATAFCIATDATGFAIQPGPSDDGKRRPCRKGHYFVLIADRDHIFFEFKPKETSAAVRAMFRGFEGYVQADAKSVFDILYKPADSADPDHDGCTRKEVACWAHARRKFWEAAFAKQVVAREALVRINRIFELDNGFRKHPPAKITALRQQFLRPHVQSFLDFAQVEYDKVRQQRGSLRSALGYCVRQKQALMTFLDDGRLRLDNNHSENNLRKVVMIRDSALFAGSDQHAESAGHILSLIASARLHNLDPQRYLRDLIRILPFWPRDRFLELAPMFWDQTRARIDQKQLAAELGCIDVPPAPERDAATPA